MAQSYTITYSFATIKVLSTTETTPVLMCTCSTIPSGITFTYGVPTDKFGATSPGNGGALLETIAEQCEYLVAGHHVIAGSPGEEIDLAGLITQNIDLVVEYVTVGNQKLFGTASVPVQAFLNQDIGIGGVVIGKSPAAYVWDVYVSLAELAGDPAPTP